MLCLYNQFFYFCDVFLHKVHMFVVCVFKRIEFVQGCSSATGEEARKQEMFRVVTIPAIQYNALVKQKPDFLIFSLY